MELKEFLNILKFSWKKIAFSGLLLAILAYAGSLIYPTKYHAQVSVYVQKTPEISKAGDYTFDGYYALQTAEGYTDTVVGFLQAPDVIRRGLEISNLPADAPQINYFSKKIKVEKAAPQLIDLSVTLQGKELSSTLVAAIAQAAQERTRILNQEGTGQLTLNLVNKEPLVSEVKPFKELNAAVGLLLGVFLSTGSVLFFNYLRTSARHET